MHAGTHTHFVACTGKLGVLNVGFELAAEITFPANETTVAGCLNGPSRQPSDAAYAALVCLSQNYAETSDSSQGGAPTIGGLG